MWKCTDPGSALPGFEPWLPWCDLLIYKCGVVIVPMLQGCSECCSCSTGDSIWHLGRAHPIDQSWVFTGRTDAEAETPNTGHLVRRADSFEQTDAGKDWGQEEKGTTEDEMVGWHHWLDGHEFGWTLGVGVKEGGLACCSPWGHKESDMTERLNWSELNWRVI